MRQVSVLIDDDMYDYVKDHGMNLSGFVRFALHEFIKKNSGI